MCFEERSIERSPSESPVFYMPSLHKKTGKKGVKRQLAIILAFIHILSIFDFVYNIDLVLFGIIDHFKQRETDMTQKTGTGMQCTEPGCKGEIMKEIMDEAPSSGQPPDSTEKYSCSKCNTDYFPSPSTRCA